MKRRIKFDITGQRFGHWKVLGLSRKRTPRGNVLWRCKCDCGTRKLLWGLLLRNGESKSCGCHYGYVMPKACRGYGAGSLFNSWRCMVDRCTNPKSIAWPGYGARGITVCARWLEPNRMGLVNFYRDMGPRPKGMSIDRKEVNGNYTPENCRWADGHTQALNRRRRTVDDDVAALAGFGE